MVTPSAIADIHFCGIKRLPYVGMVLIMSYALLKGVRVIVMPKFDPQDFLKHLVEHKVTVAHLVPPIILFLAKHPVVEKVIPNLSLKMLFVGAAPLGKDLEDACVNRLKCPIKQG